MVSGRGIERGLLIMDYEAREKGLTMEWGNGFGISKWNGEEGGAFFRVERHEHILLFIEINFFFFFLGLCAACGQM